MVVLANRRLHDVRYGSAAVHDDPFAILFAFDTRLGKPGVAHRIAHAGGQGFGLAIGRSRSNNHAFKQGREMLRVKHLDILRLDVFQTVDDGTLQFLDVFFLKGAGCFARDRSHAVLCSVKGELMGRVKAVY